jgi:hypothetical protein
MKKIFLLCLLFAFVPLAADQLIETTTLSSGDAHCPNGGLEVIIGDDGDTSGYLEDGEIKLTTYICNGENGCNTVFKVRDASSCSSHYGIIVTSGVDCDSNGDIDSGKETETELCYGSNGVNGSDVTEGTSAVDGDKGSDGSASEFVVTEEPAGENCPAGGSKIETRFDANGNGTFEESEVSVHYICNGDSPQGSQGEKGKQGIAGTDGKDGADGVKGERGDKGEQGDQGIAGEQGETGPDGFDSLVSVVDEAAGSNCENGGKKFMSGLDKDRNGVLDENEVKNSYYICNGKDAVEASEQAASSSGCSLTVF